MENEMRLIDGNVVIKETESILNFRRQHHMPTIEYEALLGYLRKLPTVDAVPVVHGWWIYDELPDEDWNIQANCSVCSAGDIQAIHKLTGEPYSVPYCWRCGAKMDGDGNG